MYIRDQVVVLKKSPYREHDRRYIMYGRRHGLLIAAARGAMKLKAKQAARLEPLTLADVMIAKGRNFDQIAVATRLDVSRQLPSTVYRLPSDVGHITSLGGLAVAGAFADLFLRLIRPGVADERLFALWEELVACLAELPQEPTALRAQLMFAAASLKLMDALGYGPALSAKCGACRHPFDFAQGLPMGPTDVWYAPGQNALVCSDCVKASKEPAIPAKVHSIALLRFMRASPLPDVLRVSLNLEVGQNVLRIIQEVWQHAPLDRQPHGLETIQAIMAG